MIHVLKCWPEPFREIAEGRKFHEVRVDDRAHRPWSGDLVLLKEFDPETKAYTGREVMRRVTHVTAPGSWGLPKDVYVFSHLPLAGHKGG